MKFIMSLIILLSPAIVSWGQSCQEIVYYQIKRLAHSHEGKIYVQREPLIMFSYIKKQEASIKHSLATNNLVTDIDTSKLELKLESVLFNCPYYCSYTLKHENITFFQEKDLFKMYQQNKKVFDKASNSLRKIINDNSYIENHDSKKEKKETEKFNRKWRKRAKSIYRLSIPIRIDENYLIIYYDQIYYPDKSNGYFALFKYDKLSKEIKFVTNL
jgi:hypothetical protein